MLQAKSAASNIPDPSQFAAKAKSAAKKVSGSVPSNPAAEFAAKAKKVGNKASGGAISNPARDFANAVRDLHTCICFCVRRLNTTHTARKMLSS